MTKEELIEHINDIEWEDFECKTSATDLPKNTWDTVSAFANTSGGWLVLGVAQKGKKFEIEGVNDPERIEQSFINTLRGGEKFNAMLSFRTQKCKIEGKLVMSFYVEPSNKKPIYFNGNLKNTFVRKGSGDMRATDEEVAAMLRDQAFGTKSEQKVDGTTMESLNKESFRRYRNYLHGANPSYDIFDDGELCEKLGITKEGTVTYGGLLMLGKRDEIQKYVGTNFFVDYIEIPGRTYSDGPTRYTYRIPEMENLWEYYLVISERLRVFVNAPFTESAGGIGVDDQKRFFCLREALVNLLAHADHFSPMNCAIRVFTDRISFQNPGRFVLDVEKLGVRMESIPRNPVIIKLFRVADIADNIGSGIDKIRNWTKLTGKCVEFHSDIYSSEVIIEREDVAFTKNDYTDFVKDFVKDFAKELSERQKIILEIIMETPSITADVISQKIGVSSRTIQTDMAKMQKDPIKVLKRIGTRKDGYWVIVHPIR